MKIKSLIIVYFLVLSVVLSCSTKPKGLLPKGYSWAYGGWISHYEDVGDASLYIGEDYLQFNLPFLRTYHNVFPDKQFNQDDMYPVRCFPKLPYSVWMENQDGVGLYYQTTRGIEAYLWLDKKQKCVSDDDAGFIRKDFELTDEMIENYDNAYKNASFWGNWRTRYQIHRNKELHLTPNPEKEVIVGVKPYMYLISLDERQVIFEVKEDVIAHAYLNNKGEKCGDFYYRK